MSDNKVIPVEQKPLTIKRDHQLVTIPAHNFSQIPKPGTRLEVSLHEDIGGSMIKAYLHEVKEDPMGPTGEKLVLEVPSSKLLDIKKFEGTWLVYPPIKELGLSDETGGFREIQL